MNLVRPYPAICARFEDAKLLHKPDAWPQGEPWPPEEDPIVAQSLPIWVLRSGRIIHGIPAPSLFGADGKPLGPLTLETAPPGTRGNRLD